MAQEPPPIIFMMNVHCGWCADSIRYSLETTFGARRVDASASMGMVVVRGGKHLDPWTIKRYLQRFSETRRTSHGGGSRKGISIASDGGRPQRSHFVGIMKMEPGPEYYEYPHQYTYPPASPPQQSYHGRRRYSYPPPPPQQSYHGRRRSSYPPPPPPGRGWY